MKSIEQLYNKAKKTYIFRLTLLNIIPYTLVLFLMTYFVFNIEIDSFYKILFAFVLSIFNGIFLAFIIMITSYKKSKVIRHFNLLLEIFPETNKSLLLLLSFYLIQNRKMYNLEKKHFFNKQMRFLSKSFGIAYNKDKDEAKVEEILIYSKNINFTE